MNEKHSEPGRIPLSPGTTLAWRIALAEAQQAGATYVETEHILIGIFSLGAFLPKSPSADNVSIGIRAEQEAIESSLCSFPVEIPALGTRIRNALPKGDTTTTVKVLHRSPKCRRCFERASEISRGEEVSCIHLLNAILEDPGSVIPGAMDSISSDPGYNMSLPGQMRNAVIEYQNGNERKAHLLRDIEHSRRAMSQKELDQVRYRKLHHELFKKNVELARVCIRVHDTEGLARALLDLSTFEIVLKDRIMDLITQVEYLHTEGICLGPQSAAQIEMFLQNLEKGNQG